MAQGTPLSRIAEHIILLFRVFRIRKEFLGRKSLADKGHSQIRSKSLGRKINLRKKFIGRKTLLIKVIHKSGVNP